MFPIMYMLYCLSAFFALALSIDLPKGLTIKDTLRNKECKERSDVGDIINWKYHGTLTDGKVFDSGKFSAMLGNGDVIEGVDIAMLDMCVGDKRTMTMTSDLAYGDEGTGGIPPKATINFDVEMTELIKGKCADTDDYADRCPKWAEEGECRANKSWMSEYCTKSCNVGACIKNKPKTKEL